MKSSLAEVNENSFYLKFINFLAQSQSSFEGEYEVKTNTVDKIFEDISLQKTLLKIDVEDFEISKSMMGMEIKVTGNLPLVSGDKTKLDGNDPWVLRIRKTANRTLQTPYPYRMALETTNHFASFKSEFSKLNMFMSPDPLQPLLLKIRNRDKLKLRVFTGSVEIQGKHHSIYEGEVAKRISLKMKGGVYKHTEPLIFFNIQ